MGTDYTVLKNTHYYDDAFEEEDYLIVPTKEITDGYLHNTYNGYGQQISTYDAGDYTFGNGWFDVDLFKTLESECGDYIKQTYGVDDEDFKDWVYKNIIQTTDGDSVELDNGKDEFLSDVVKQFVEENQNYTKATYINYWDGHNYQSIIIDTEGYESEYEFANDEEEDAILAAYDKFSPNYVQGVATEFVDGYTFESSQWQGDVFDKVWEGDKTEEDY